MQEIDDLAKVFSAGKTLEDLRRSQEQFEQRHAVKQPPTQKEIDYAQKVYSTQKAEIRATPKVITKECDFEKAKDVLKKYMRIRAGQLSIIKGQDFRWDFDESQKFVLNDLIRYFINDKESTIPLNKGLFIFGAYGVGKTEIMQCFQKMCIELNLSKSFDYVVLSEVYTQAKGDKEFDPITPNLYGTKLFDEFGRNVGGVLRFGEPIDINEGIIEARYRRYKTYGKLTHFITNATPNEIDGIVSGMIADRLREMTKSVLFSGQSKRV